MTAQELQRAIDVQNTEVARLRAQYGADHRLTREAALVLLRLHRQLKALERETPEAA